MIRETRYLITAILLFLAAIAGAQVTTSSMSGRVTDAAAQAIMGATVRVVHEPSGTAYGTVTDASGRYAISGMKAGGPYRVSVSYVGYATVETGDITLRLADRYVLNVAMTEKETLLTGVTVRPADHGAPAAGLSPGSVTHVSARQIGATPTVSRSMTDIIRLSPVASATSNGLAIGGGNFRQSNVTVDGAGFNNAFGLGTGILPGGGMPISLDAIEQMTVAATPYDVRQSGFTGGTVNAVTRSGTNRFRATAYTYLTNDTWTGDRVGDERLDIATSHSYTYGFSAGGPIVRDRLFFFVNGEYEANMEAGPTAKAGGGDAGTFSDTNRRPREGELASLTDYLKSRYGMTTGPWQDYNVETPAYRLLARLDWNITDRHRFNVRFTRSNRKQSSPPANSRTVGVALPSAIYNASNVAMYGSNSYYGMTSLASRYYSEYRFTSLAAELDSRMGRWTNTLRATYSFQDQPRSTEYGDQPTLEIVMNDGQGHYPTWAMTGDDVFTAGNLTQTKNLVLTDEAAVTLGRHRLTAGLQYEQTRAVNAFAQAAAGYYAYEATPEEVRQGRWDDVFGRAPRVFAISYGNGADHSMFQAEMTTRLFSLYLQDEVALTDRLTLTGGLRLERPVYPALKDNYNEGYHELDFGGTRFRTDNVPGASVSLSPRLGFRWDITGDNRYVLRGGTGLFVGRMPFVWLISAVGNSGMGQTSYFYVSPDNEQAGTGAYAAAGSRYPALTMDRREMLTAIGAESRTVVPTGPTILSDGLRMPRTWKMSLAFDTRLPYDVDFTLEGVCNRDMNPCVVSNRNVYWDGGAEIRLSDFDTRRYMSTYGRNQAYVIENAGHRAYYWAVTAQLRRHFRFGLDVSAAYTRAGAKSYSEGIGDQVSSAYVQYRNSISAVNDAETGYATYVAPNRVLVSVSYRMKTGRHHASSFGLVYDGGEHGYMGNYSYTRFSYIFTGNVTGDVSAPGNLIRVPASREELDSWNFADNGTFTAADGSRQTYTADMQRDDFWTYVCQDGYLKTRKGRYAERGGASMPWHHQLDFRFTHDISLNVGTRRHTLQLGCDIANLPNLLNRSWGLYKQLTSGSLLTYRPGNGSNGSDGSYTYNLVNGERHLTTFRDYVSAASTYRVMFSVRYVFE